MNRRKSSYGFSIIELLVVIGIVAVLLGILLPTVARAREIGRRTACAANLRSIGIAARALATENGGKFPITFSLPFEKLSDRKRMPMVISLDSSLMADEAKWKALGVPMSQWNKAGAIEGVWKCPSSPHEQRKYNLTNPDEAKNWGPVLRMDYMYVAGMVGKTEMGKSKGNWGVLMPAVSLYDPRPDEKLLAADAAFVAGSSQWGSRSIHINHPSSKNGHVVDYQGVLYADGHVSSTPPGYLPKPLSQDTSNYSLVHDTGSVKGYLFWGATVAYTPGKVRPPPPPPAPPPPPSPTPPASSTPSTPKPSPTPAPPPPPPTNVAGGLP